VQRVQVWQRKWIENVTDNVEKWQKAEKSAFMSIFLLQQGERQTYLGRDANIAANRNTYACTHPQGTQTKDCSLVRLTKKHTW
jgi:hypothetical protein